ncbi:DUF2793 domain-containing protein [Sphingomonas sp. GlSt437]|uniref:DUF2793 domain-containing protein n=1 Tax=Sphingomonas sp. GlSt437 TaxID=3389970 RepID=UPI003A875ED7
MADTTSRLALPLLQAGQAQKELYHNEALALLDLTVAAAVESVGLDSPPASPTFGQCWIIGDAPTGDWSGHANALAGWTEGGWRFVTPRAGLSAWSTADAVFCRFDGIRWAVGDVPIRRLTAGGVQVVGSQQPGIESPTGGTVVDPEARTAIAAILAALRRHGLIAS